MKCGLPSYRGKDNTDVLVDYSIAKENHHVSTSIRTIRLSTAGNAGSDNQLGTLRQSQCRRPRGGSHYFDCVRILEDGGGCRCRCSNNDDYLCHPVLGARAKVDHLDG